MTDEFNIYRELPFGISMFCLFVVVNILFLIYESFTSFSSYVGLYDFFQIVLAVVVLILLHKRKKVFLVFFGIGQSANLLVLLSAYAYGEDIIANFFGRIFYITLWGTYFYRSKYVRNMGNLTAMVQASEEDTLASTITDECQCMTVTTPQLPFSDDSETPPIVDSHPTFEGTKNNTDIPVEINSNFKPVTSSPKRYCKMCGAPLNGNRKCYGCGKQYFHINFIHVLKIYATLVTVGLLAMFLLNMVNYNNAIAAYDEITKSWAKTDDLKEQLTSIKDELTLSKREYYSLKKNYDDLKHSKFSVENELKYYRAHAVFVVENGTKYHTAKCFHIKGKAFYIYNSEAAEGRGYTPCADCW